MAPESGHIRMPYPYETTELKDGTVVISVPLTLEELPVSGGSYTASDEEEDWRTQIVHGVQHWNRKGYGIIEWTGEETYLLLDREGRVFLVLVGSKSTDIERECQEAYEELARIRTRITFTNEQVHHKRGDFPAVNVGVTHGGGTLVPSNTSLAPALDKEMRALNSKPFMARIAASQSKALKRWYPRLHRYYTETLECVWSDPDALTKGRSKSLKPNFDLGTSVWPTAAYNFGPAVVTKVHRDTMNLPYGICAVTAFGKFNYKTSGHLVLRQIRTLVQFPPGSTILLPSGCVEHGNTAIASDEYRGSFTQYCHGDLFRFIENGYQNDNEIKATDREKFKSIHEERLKTRWKRGLALFSYITEFI